MRYHSCGYLGNTMILSRRYCAINQINKRQIWGYFHSIRHRNTSSTDKGPILDIAVDSTDENIIYQVKRGDLLGLPIIHHHDYVSELPPRHRFAMRKFHGVMKYLRKDNVISMKQVLQPGLVSAQTVSQCHSPDYVDKFFTGRTDKDEQRRTGFVWNEGLVRRCRLETGGTVLGARLALDRGLACSTGGGTHHAFPTYGSGFCLINDMATAARHLLDRALVDRVLIVDLDVHQGDGTAAIFQDDSGVFTFSMHAESNFPLRKQTSDLDLGLPDHTQDQEYMKELTTYLPAILDVFRPDIVIYDAGVDPHVRDELGRLDLTDQGLYDRDLYVFDTVLGHGIPCISVIGGGYSTDLNQLSIRHTIVHRAASKVWQNRQL